LGDRVAAAGVLVGVALDRLDVGLQVVVGEDRGRRVGQDAVREQVLGRARDGVGRVVDAGHAVAVLVDGDPADLLGRRVAGAAAPGVAGRAADADLHGPGGTEAVLAAVHARQGGPAVVALHGADPGQD